MWAVFGAIDGAVRRELGRVRVFEREPVRRLNEACARGHKKRPETRCQDREQKRRLLGVRDPERDEPRKS